MKSGVNFAINQDLLDKLVVALKNTAQSLIDEPKLNLNFSNLLSFQIPDQSNPNGSFIPVFDFSVENLYFSEFTFDETQSSITLLEPSQKIKLYFNNIKIKMDFVCSFNTTDNMIGLKEKKSASLTFDSVSLTMVVKLESQNNLLALNISEIIFSARSD